jgi:hypothetical protein
VDKNAIADQLQSALDAFNSPSKAHRNRDSGEFRAINTSIRAALRALGEDAHEVETLEARGLFTGHYADPIPDSFVPGIETLIEDLRA